MSDQSDMDKSPFEGLQRDVQALETVDVFCTGCNSWTKMNARYAAVLKTGEISSCSKCR